MLETNTSIYPRFMKHGDGNPKRKRKGKPFLGLPLMSAADVKEKSMRLMEEAKGPILYTDPSTGLLTVGDPPIKTAPWAYFDFPVLTEDTIALLEALNRKAPTSIQARVKGGVSVLERPLEHLNLTTLRTPQTTTTTVRTPTVLATPFSVHQSNRSYHRPYTPNNTNRPDTFNSYDPLSENLNPNLKHVVRSYTSNNTNRLDTFNSYGPLSENFNQLNLNNNHLKHVPNNFKQENRVGNNLKQETHVQNEVENENRGVINFDAYEDIPVRVTGSDVPDPVHLFTDIDLGNVLNENIRVRCKYVKTTPIQRHAIPVVMGGRDLMACAQTGSGKTAVFCFPIISGVMKMGLGNGGGFESAASPLALVLSPTRKLCCQIFEETKKLCYQTGVKVAVAYGGAPIFNQLRSFERGVDILVATPGRLADMVERSKISLKNIKYLALDEADRMLDMGFEPQIRKIVERMDMPPPCRRQTMLFSATFPSEIQRLASDFLSNYIFLSVGRVGSSTDLIQQKISDFSGSFGNADAGHVYESMLQVGSE